MFKKTGLSTLLLIGASIIGIGFATTTLWPDTAEYPRYPAESGGIGYILRTYFGVDGTAKNTEKLAGVTASGYLHHQTCTDPNHVWTGIDPATGIPQCGTRAALLTMIGSFTEISGTAEVLRIGTSSWSPITLGESIYAGDTVRMNSTSSGVVQFASDESILRLDRDTTVLLQTGDLDGNTVAEAILLDGSLWGRVMTSTGINLGGGGLVAGVRGTSVSIWKRSSQYTLTVIDSTATGEDAAKISCKDLNGKTQIATIGAYYQGSKADNGTCPSNLGSKKYKYETYASDEWIKKNTKKDLHYLKKNKDRSDRIRREYESTVPTDADTASLESLCDTDQVYWKSLIGTTHEPCQSKGLVAFADFTQPLAALGYQLYFNDGTSYPIQVKGNPSWSTQSGYTINAPGQYIMIDPALVQAELASKITGATMGIKLAGQFNITDTNSKYIANFESASYFIMRNGFIRTGIGPVLSNIGGITQFNIYIGGYNPSLFEIGNINTGGGYSKPMKNSILGVTIKK